MEVMPAPKGGASIDPGN